MGLFAYIMFYFKFNKLYTPTIGVKLTNLDETLVNKSLFYKCGG